MSVLPNQLIGGLPPEKSSVQLPTITPNSSGAFTYGKKGFSLKTSILYRLKIYNLYACLLKKVQENVIFKIFLKSIIVLWLIHVKMILKYF